MSNQYERFKEMVESSQDWFWEFDEKATFTYVSPSIKKLLGYEPEELLGRNAFELMTADEAERVHQHFDPIAEKYLPFSHLVNINLHKDGQEVVIESSGTPIFDENGQFRGYRGVDRDITQRRAVEDELRQSREKLQNIFDASSEWIWEIDLNGRHTYSNQRLMDFLGYSQEEFLGKDYSDFLHQEDLLSVQEILPRLISEKKGWRSWVLRWKHKNGGHCFLESNAAPIINADGEVVGYRGADRDITERKAMEESYRRLASLTSDYVHCCTRAGKNPFRIQWVDGAVNSISGYRIDEVLSLGCFLPLVHPDDHQIVSDYLLGLVPGDRKSIEFRIVTSTQEVRWVLEKSQCEAGSSEGELLLLGAVTDITERKMAEDALLKNRKMLSQTQQLAKVGSWQYDVVGNHLVWSDETHRIFGTDPQTFTVSYEAFLNLVHPDDRAKVKTAYSESLQARHDSYEVDHRIILKNTGEIRYVHEKCSHDRDASGAVIRSVGMAQDVTERKTYEMALRAATQAAEAANRAKSLLLAKISHEIRTPLTAIIGYGELMDDAELTAEQSKYLAAINTSSNTLLLLINDILDLAKIESGELVIKPVDFSLRDLIGKLVTIQEPQVASKGLALSVSIDPAVPDLLVGDPLRIKQLLINLVSNAVKFTEQGAISIAVSLAEDSGPRVLLDIAVRDTGIGISEELVEEIFKPFVQGFDPTSNHYGGTGLGLAISQSLAGLMGGSVNVNSEVGVGSTFHLLVPLQRDTYARSEAPRSERMPLQWHGPALNILLTEDNPTTIHFVETVLKNIGHAVTVAENGMAALELLPTSNFDVVLLDIQMPVMNGVEALRALRSLEQFSDNHQPVIALTAYALIGDKEKYLKMGFDGYLSKPFTTRELMDELLRVCILTGGAAEVDA